LLLSDADMESKLQRMLSRIKSFKESEFINKFLFEPSMHLLKNPGKLLRPMLVFIGAEIVDDKSTDYTDLAASIELLHVSSLIHDDIIDKSEFRRGTQSVHSKYGEDAAILAGDALIAKAIQIATPYGREVLDSISGAAMKMCAGEMLDSLHANKPVTLQEYTKIAELKSASLIGTSLSIAGVYSGSKSAEQLYNIGLNAGIAFQIRDDVLDFLEGAEDEAKSAGIVRRAKHSLISTMDEVKKAVKLNNSYIENAMSLLADLQSSRGSELLAKSIEFIRLDKNAL